MARFWSTLASPACSILASIVFADLLLGLLEICRGRKSPFLPRLDTFTPPSRRARFDYFPLSLPISENNGMYIEITTPPTTTPKNTIMIGSNAVNKSFTAASTSSS